MALADFEEALQAEASRPHPSALAALIAAQDALGYVSPEALELILAQLPVSKAELHGVLGFYSDLRTEPPGKHIVRVCQGDSCFARSSSKVLRSACKAAKVSPGQTSKNGRVTLDVVYCLGNCARAPSVMVDGEVRGDVTPGGVKRLVEGLK